VTIRLFALTLSGAATLVVAASVSAKAEAPPAYSAVFRGSELQLRHSGGAKRLPFAVHFPQVFADAARIKKLVVISSAAKNPSLPSRERQSPDWRVHVRSGHPIAALG
jgi:hypothetical protein